MRSKFMISLLVLSLFCLMIPVSAQEVLGNIVGTVTDSSGAAIPNATVKVINTATGLVVRTLTTNAEGGYSALSIPIGMYSVEAEATGFSKGIVTKIEVNVNDRLSINPVLKAGGVGEVMTVEAEPLQVELQQATSSTLISGEQIRELSLNNRNYIQLVSLMPGVSYGGGDQIYIGTTNPDGQTNVISFSINGQRTSQNNWTIDGADNVDRGSNLTLLNYPSVDAIAEFKVLRGQYTAEFGRTSAGHVNVVTKSGTKDFHGSAYEFVRNDFFNANSYINNARNLPRPRQRYNNFGYTIGGPVIIPGLYNPAQRRTFFFFSQEFRRVQRQSTLSGLAPTAAERAGNFTHPVCISPNTYSASCTGTTGTTVAAINPIAQQYIQAIWANIPTPTDPVLHQIFTPVSSTFNHRQELARVDHQFTSNWTISGRFLNDHIPTIEPGGLFTGAVLPGVSTTSTNSPGRSWVFRSVNSFNPTLLLEAGYAFSYGAIISRLQGRVSSAISSGVSPTLPFPSTLARIPAVSYTNGPSTITGFGPYDNFNRNHNVFANMTKTLTKHTLKWGGQYFHYQKTENAGGNNAGTFNFNSNGVALPATATPGYTLAQTQANARFQQAWANFLVGDVTSFTQASLDITPDINTNQWEVYFQDDWKPFSNLTVNLGVRYSMFREVHDENGVLTNFDPSRYDPARAPTIGGSGATRGLITSAPGTYDPLNGLIHAGVNSPYGNKVGRESTNNWAPRIGFAWDPYGKGKTALRGGYGISYDFFLVGIYEQNAFTNPPVVDTITINDTRFENVTASVPTVSAAPRNLRATPTVGKTPSIQSWSLDFQQEFWGGIVAAIGYYGNVGRHQIGIVDMNQPTPGQLVISNGVPSTTLGPHINQVRPYRGYGPIAAILPIFTSNYNGLQASLQKKWKSGSQISSSYTWSKGLTTAQTDRSSSPQNLYNLEADYGPSQLDRTHIFTTNYVWMLPWMRDQKGFLGHVLGGWQASGIVNMYSGLPLTITTTGVDPAGQGYNIATSPTSGRPDLIGNPNGAQGTDFQSGPLWFNTAAFAHVCPVTTPATTCANPRPGTAGRGVVRGPGFIRTDFSVFKNFRIGEQVKLQFRTETFNLFNHTNPSGVSTVFGSSTFGRITSYRDPREMQFGLKLSF